MDRKGRGTIRQLARFLGPYWLPSILAPLCMALEVAMDLVQPSLLARIVDEGVAQSDVSLVLNTGFLMVALALVGVLGGIGSTIFAVQASQGFGADLRSELFAKVQSLSFGNLDKMGTGPLVTRLTSDVVQIQEVVLVVLRIMVRAPLLLAGSLIMAVLVSPELALILVVLMPPLIGMIVWVARRSHTLYMGVQDRLDKLNAVIQENLAGVRVVKAFVRAGHERQRFGVRNDSLMDQTVQAIRLVAIVMPFMMLVVNLGIAATIWFGGVQVIQGDLQIGQILAFVNYLLMTLFSLMMVGMLLMRVFRATASAERVQKVFDSEPEICERSDPVRILQPQGRVAFEGVTFTYNGSASRPVLREVSFQAEPGQTVAILGATGSGKSTLVNLIPRFYDVTEGCVTFDGIDVRNLEKGALRQNIGMVLQESILFSGTIFENIQYGQAGSLRAKVVAAAQAAQAHDFITQFPDGYDTKVGQRGVNLSGGQKQRIAIARALLIQPAVLILDDSTSAIDVETEARLQQALTNLMSGRTVFVIAQRISSVLAADKILVLERGRIAAQGQHRELLASSTIYREIYESQLGDGVEGHVSE